MELWLQQVQNNLPSILVYRIGNMLHRKATQLARNPIYHSKTKHIEIDNALHQKQGCTILKALPTKITMESPKTRVLSCCSKLKKFPEIVGSMASLMTLMLDGTALQELPFSIELLSGLDLLNLNDCNNLSRFPSTINGLKSLKALYLFGFSNLGNVPKNLMKIESLEELDLSGTALESDGIELLYELMPRPREVAAVMNDEEPQDYPYDVSARKRQLTDRWTVEVFCQLKGGEVVEGIIDYYSSYFPEDKVYLSASAEAFSLMTNLRLLKISNVQLPRGLEYLSNRLRLLDWRRYPLKSLPSNLQLDDIFEFKMHYSCIEELWKGIKPLNMLRVLELSHSENLIKTPDFTKVPNLEVLDLEGCTRLREIHQSLLRHNKLILLNLKGCTSLTTLPGEIFMESLKTLVLSGCSKLKKFPDIVGGMECLQELRLDGTDIKELPVSIELMSGLVSLNLKDCRNLASLPITIGSLECLQTLVLSGCSKIVKFPETVISVVDLSELFLDGTSITEVPSSIELLTKLQWLNLNDCRSLVRLPSSINGLKSLKTLNLSGCFKLENVPETLGQVESLEELDISGTAIRQPPSSIFLMKNLKELSCRGCKGSPSSASWFLRSPINLMRWSSDPVALSLPSSLSGLCSLTKLDISDYDLGEGAIPSSIGDLCSLEKLCLSRNSFVSLPASIYRLSNLQEIELEECKMLQTLPRLPASIQWILLDGCVSLETLSDVLKLNEHRLPLLSLECVDCLKLTGNYDLATLKILRSVSHSHLC
ncbi:ADP-ribosyl cyclase/cyclic ADP-ribose hydrolase [Citrus sinensis]|uniref:ADP-ribosyl cyclase/cyclic ADP-ribose hydrolase n=1 Tax=Citrus sinensis TaxID=2711 RepID=A0ACB8M830_CITSI|nr:ADP-ribosyl cyclase/cyclic ADP-ribose hydrolase [Citrus sinensis]